METFLIGGFIRDKFLNLTHIEKDWLILKTDFRIMFHLKFKLVGKNFPVFLHPLTKEEYALARTERKTKKGYQGFKCYFSNKVDLKTDVYRRDLSINTLTLNNQGFIISTLTSKIDFKNKILKHISSGFSDDPVRIFRIARFWNKYYKKGFLISANTYFLIKKIILNNEINYLTNERITKEFYLSINFQYNYNFFYILHLSGALRIIFKDLNSLIKISIINNFNIYLNTWLQICNIYLHLNKYSNNHHIKISYLFFKLKIKLFHKNIKKNKNRFNAKILYSQYKNKFTLSKKLIKFITMLSFFYIFYNLSKINYLKIKNSLYKLNLTKDKIKIINSLLLLDLENNTNKKVNFFYKKYLILDIINKLTTLPFSKNNLNKKFLKKYTNFYKNFYKHNTTKI